MYIYILELEKNKYYIGNTDTLSIDDHLHGKHPYTKKYKPLRVTNIIETGNSLDEEYYAIYYMKRYGIMNVYSNINKSLINMFKCKRCKVWGHNLTTCTKRTDMYGYYIIR